MVCIYCQGTTGVKNSRHQKILNQVWRRRQCHKCNAVFTTLESTDLATALVVSGKNAYKPFSRDKLFLGVYDSLKHRKTALADATGLTDTIVSKLYPYVTDGQIGRHQIISTSIITLKRFDKVAATYYEAYHPLIADG